MKFKKVPNIAFFSKYVREDSEYIMNVLYERGYLE